MDTSSTNATPPLQQALHHSPGKYCAVVLLDRLGKTNDKLLRSALASLMKCLEETRVRPKNLHVLCAISPALAGSPDTRLPPLDNDTSRMPITQQDALLQISAMTRTDLLYALRICHSTLKSAFVCKDEIYGGQLRFDQEPFGFYHGNEDEQKDLNAVARITDGPMAGGSWLLYQLYRQDMQDFYAQSQAQQEDVMGAPVLNVPHSGPREYPASAHTRVAHAPGNQPVMIRRGFAYRHQGHEGTAFLAAAADPKGFSDTLQRMLAQDALLGFVQALQGGLYFVPPNADWLDASAPIARIPEDAERLPLRKPEGSDGRPVALNDYLVSAAFTRYIDLLRENALFEGPVGKMTFNPDILKLLQAINAVAAGAKLDTSPVTQGGDQPTIDELNQLVNTSLEDANLFNGVTGKYMTVG